MSAAKKVIDHDEDHAWPNARALRPESLKSTSGKVLDGLLQFDFRKAHADLKDAWKNAIFRAIDGVDLDQLDPHVARSGEIARFSTAVER